MYAPFLIEKLRKFSKLFLSDIRIVGNMMKRGEQLDAIWLFTRANLFGGFDFCRSCHNTSYVFW